MRKEYASTEPNLSVLNCLNGLNVFKWFVLKLNMTFHLQMTYQLLKEKKRQSIKAIACSVAINCCQ